MKLQELLCRRFPMLGLYAALWAAGALLFGSTNARSAVVEAWVQRYGSGFGSAEDLGSAIITDLSGNVITAGTSDGQLTGSDLVITKYSGATGAVLWQQRHNGPGNNVDSAGRLALDSAGNVVVVGSSFGIGTGLDIYTAKYAASDGTLLWEHRYNGLGNYNDWGASVVVDQDGNVVVTGITAAGPSYDIYTAKHAAADGAVLWQTTYNGPSSRDDSPVGVAVDDIGNVILVGGSPDASNSESNLVTIKYAAANGTMLWERRTKGPALRAMAMARNGDLVVTGNVGPAHSPDILTARYAAATGGLLWERRYNGPAGAYDQPNGLALDVNGNVIIAGQSYVREGGFQYYTAKYGATDGALIWERRAGVSSGTGSFARSVAVDSRGDVVVTGELGNDLARFDYYTIKYASADGATIWEQRYDGPGQSHDQGLAVTVDNQNNVAVTGASTGAEGSIDIYTAKYARANGALIWEQRYDGPRERYDAANAAATDRDGSVIVAGTAEGGTGGNDIYTIKYSADGGILWAQRYDGPRGAQDAANAVAVDGSGNVVITGYSVGPDGGPDFYTAKYAAGNGALLWEKRYDGPLTSYDEGKVVAVDGNGEVVVTGQSYSSDGGEAAPDFYTAKYAGTDGSLIWERRYDGAGADDFPTGLQVDRHGNVVVAGFTAGWEGDVDFYTAKYAAADGALLWERRYNGPANYSDHANAVALDAEGNVLVTGSSAGRLLPVYYDYYTAKFAAADGALIWEVRYDGPSSLDDEPLAVTTDSDGNAIVTGYSHGANGGQDIYTAKYRSTDGALVWERRLHGPTLFGENIGRAVAVDGVGNAVVSGSSFNGANSDFYTAKYAATDGALLWEQRYNGPKTGLDSPGAHALALGPNGMTVVAGRSDYDFATVVYRDGLSPIINCPTNIVADFSNDAGAVVRFAVTARDSGGATPAVTCTPPSGSRFPMGQTTVVCIATDKDALSATCHFTITVRGARGAMADVLAGLVVMRTTVTDREDSRRLDQSIGHLTEALATELWWDETHVDPELGESEFRESGKSVDILCALTRTTRSQSLRVALYGFIDRFVQAHRLLASVAIADSSHAGSSHKDIEQARRFLAKGDAAQRNRQCGNGLEDYRNAWTSVIRANGSRDER